ncbi:hypothetical protein PHJA_002639200 [Phtheirospermum japonicum]|uniref:Uncharacterized protein n=1 Tax=Phtheirospermum japonicum TaxID=374723 RepID=A0A830CYE2_9LAMI|nr:hypothetical protein PHJA_002639200 [Phtheirospermum japonicum]
MSSPPETRVTPASPSTPPTVVASLSPPPPMISEAVEIPSTSATSNPEGVEVSPSSSSDPPEIAVALSLSLDISAVIATSSSEGVKHPPPPLDYPKITSILSQNSVDEVNYKYNIKDPYDPYAPPACTLACQAPAGRVTFYVDQFQAGLRLPVYPMMLEIANMPGVHFIHKLPTSNKAWRKKFFFVHCEGDWGFDPTPIDALPSYPPLTAAARPSRIQKIMANLNANPINVNDLLTPLVLKALNETCEIGPLPSEIEKMMRLLFEATDREGAAPDSAAPVQEARTPTAPRAQSSLQAASSVRPRLVRQVISDLEEDDMPLMKMPRSRRGRGVVISGNPAPMPAITPTAPTVRSSGPPQRTSVLNCSGDVAVRHVSGQCSPEDLRVLEQMSDRELLESWCQDEVRAEAKRALLAIRATRSLGQATLDKEVEDLKERIQRQRALSKDKIKEVKNLQEEVDGLKKAQKKMIETARAEARDEGIAEARSLADEDLDKAKSEWKAEFLNSEEGLSLVQVARDETKKAFLGSKDLFSLLFPEAVVYYNYGLDEQAKWIKDNPDTPLNRKTPLKTPPEPTSFSYDPAKDRLHMLGPVEFAEHIHAVLHSSAPDQVQAQPDLTLSVISPTSSPSPNLCRSGSSPPATTNRNNEDVYSGLPDPLLGQNGSSPSGDSLTRSVVGIPSPHIVEATTAINLEKGTPILSKSLIRPGDPLLGEIGEFVNSPVGASPVQLSQHQRSSGLTVDDPSLNFLSRAPFVPTPTFTTVGPLERGVFDKAAANSSPNVHSSSLADNIDGRSPFTGAANPIPSSCLSLEERENLAAAAGAQVVAGLRLPQVPISEDSSLPKPVGTVFLFLGISV